MIWQPIFYQPFLFDPGFPNSYRFTVNEYQNICRIKKAQILLRETSLTMTEIAMETGFGSLPYFERVFRKATAQTPMQYKKSHPSP